MMTHHHLQLRHREEHGAEAEHGSVVSIQPMGRSVALVDLSLSLVAQEVLVQLEGRTRTAATMKPLIVDVSLV